MVVEVSSPSTRSFDLGEKKDRYAVQGCAAFWFVDLDREVILTFSRVGADSFGDPLPHARGERFTIPLLPGLHLDVDDRLGPSSP